MQRVLIIAENSLQQERLCNTINFDQSIQLTTANIRQINPKNLRVFKQSDLIVMEDTPAHGDPRTTEFLLSSLKTTGLPIVLLPAIEDQGIPNKEPLVLNLSETSIAQPGLAALINKIRSQYTSRVHGQPPEVLSEPALAHDDLVSAPVLLEERQSSTLMKPPESARPQRQSAGDASKILFALTAMGRISKQLREPLSNMNLAIHMLSQVRSIEERDRYVKLLREEYQRELQLVNELDNLHASIQSKL